jgi:hypothetical protein
VEYEHNIGQFIRDHAAYVISGGSGCVGYSAQRRGRYGRGKGQKWTDLTLDGLAGQLEQAERETETEPALT